MLTRCRGNKKFEAIVSIGICIAAFSPLWADDIVTTNGEVFKNVKITSIEKEAIVLASDHGILRIRFDELPREIQAKYGHVTPVQIPTSVSAMAVPAATPAPAASAPTVATTQVLPSSQAQPQVAENGSYYGEPNKYGVPKTVAVRGYFRKDGTYVRGYYRSRPHH